MLNGILFPRLGFARVTLLKKHNCFQREEAVYLLFKAYLPSSAPSHLLSVGTEYTSILQRFSVHPPPVLAVISLLGF